MKHICWLFLFFLLITGCNSNKNTSDPSDYIPNTSILILNINNLEHLKSSLNNNDFLQEFSKTSSYKNLNSTLHNLTYFKTTHPVLLCFSKDSKDSLQYSIVTKLTSDLFKVDSLPNVMVETLSNSSFSINKTTIENNTLYSTIKDSLFLASSSQSVLETSLSQKNDDAILKKFLKAGHTDKPLSLIIDDTQGSQLFSPIIDASVNVSQFSNFTLLDVDLNQNEFILNGITKAIDSSKSLVNVFKNTLPQENLMASITPSNSDGFMSLTFDSFNTFKSNLDQYNSNDSITDSSLFNNIIEIGVIYEGKNRAVVLNSTDEIETNDALLNDQNIELNFRQIDIFNYSNPALFSNTFAPFISFNNALKYCVIDQFFVFSNSTETLQNIIINYQNKTTINQRNYFKDTQAYITDESSLLYVYNAATLGSILENHFNSSQNIDVTAYKASVLQYVYDTNFAHVNLILKKNKARVRENSVSEAYNIRLVNEILNTPQLVKNHITKQKEIIVQDINNNVYLISNTGKILWKKQLQGAILGQIEQIDMYKNGRLQLAFATSNRVYVLDRKGRDVSPFPMKFNDKITQPLSVFDYDKKKKYRLLVTQGKDVLMYDIKGKIVSGFKFKSANSSINHQPQHLRVGRKDYLFVKTDNKLHILDRTGKTRVTPKQSHSYSNQAMYLYKNKFTTTSKNGDLVTIDTNGSTSTQNINLSEDHELVTTSKTLVALNENKLTIKHNTLELDFGNYDTPKLFYINDKIYVSITDLQTQKVYLYDSNAKLLSNFPVYGNSAIVLDNIDKDRNLEFVTKGENNSILIYQIN